MCDREFESLIEKLRKEVVFYSKRININKANWRISNPTIVGAKSEIKLDPGFYKIKYSGTARTSEAGGLVLFVPENKKVARLLHWHRGVGTAEEASIVSFSQSVYVEIGSTRILSITNNKLEYLPENTKTTYTVNIHKLDEAPN